MTDIREPVSSSIVSVKSSAPNIYSLSGTIIERTRRMVPHDNPNTGIVAYAIQDDYNRKYYLDDYAPNGYHELHSSVRLLVYVKAYAKKNGGTSYTLNVQKTDHSCGEPF